VGTANRRRLGIFRYRVVGCPAEVRQDLDLGQLLAPLRQGVGQAVEGGAGPVLLRAEARGAEGSADPSGRVQDAYPGWSYRFRRASQGRRAHHGFSMPPSGLWQAASPRIEERQRPEGSPGSAGLLQGRLRAEEQGVEGGVQPPLLGPHASGRRRVVSRSSSTWPGEKSPGLF